MEDVVSGRPFGKCPIDKYPGPVVEAVSDSSRYFVLKMVNEIGQTAFIGIGFENRIESTEFNTVLKKHFKYAVFIDNISVHIIILLYFKGT